MSSTYKISVSGRLALPLVNEYGFEDKWDSGRVFGAEIRFWGQKSKQELFRDLLRYLGAGLQMKKIKAMFFEKTLFAKCNEEGKKS